MSPTVYHTTGPDAGVPFPTIEAAEAWLASEGFQPRPSQPGQFVKLLLTGNEFASLVTDDGYVWTPNFGKNGGAR